MPMYTGMSSSMPSALWTRPPTSARMPPTMPTTSPSAIIATTASTASSTIGNTFFSVPPRPSPNAAPILRPPSATWPKPIA